MPITQFIDKTAVVTGAASGIGFALASKFAALGMNVVLADVEPDSLDEAVVRISESGASVIGVVTDVRSAEQVDQLAARAVDQFGGVALVCNNAGVNSSADFADLSIEAWKWVMDVNFYGVLNGCRTFLPLLQQQPEAHIVNTGSSASFWAGMPTFGAYASSKFAVLALSESLSMELEASHSHVGVSILTPGSVRTRITDSERNLPPGVPSTSELPSAVATLDMIREYIRTEGMEAPDVADRVADAVKDNSFYILTHRDEALDSVTKRLGWMTNGTSPTRA